MKKKAIKLFTVFNYFNNDYLKFLSNYYDITLTEDPTEKDITLALFTGGADVNPEYYNERIGLHTSINYKRDTIEEEFFNSLPLSLPKIGICRGSQFLTVMSGGRLIQHVTGHGRSHLIRNNNDELIDVTSTHHQMMYPFDLDKDKYKILASSSEFLSEKYLNGDNVNIDIPDDFEECEVVYYPETNSLCIQGHPEFPHASEEFKNYTIKLIENAIQGKL